MSNHSVINAAARQALVRQAKYIHPKFLPMISDTYMALCLAPFGPIPFPPNGYRHVLTSSVSPDISPTFGYTGFQMARRLFCPKCRIDGEDCRSAVRRSRVHAGLQST